MKLPIVYPLTSPSSQSTSRMTAIVSSMWRLLPAALRRRAQPCRASNGCARKPRLAAAASAFALVFASALPASAQDETARPPQPSASPFADAGSFAQFLGGAAVGLATHEAGHLFFDVVFDADPGLGKVNFHGLPFFAITHRNDM